MDQANRHRRVAIIQLPFNLLNTEADDGLLQKAFERGKGILVRETLANGFLSGKYNNRTRFPEDDFRAALAPHVLSSVFDSVRLLEPYRRPTENWVDFSLRFVLDRPEISCAIVGARTPAQVEALRTAGAIVASPASSGAAARSRL